MATGLNAGIAAGGFWAMAAAAAAAAAAVAGIALMLDQLNKLLTEAGGWAGIAAGVKSLMAGKGFFKGVDEAANEKARAKAKAEGRDFGFSAVPVGSFPEAPTTPVPTPAIAGTSGAGNCQGARRLGLRMGYATRRPHAAVGRAPSRDVCLPATATGFPRALETPS